MKPVLPVKKYMIPMRALGDEFLRSVTFEPSGAQEMTAYPISEISADNEATIGASSVISVDTVGCKTALRNVRHNEAGKRKASHAPLVKPYNKENTVMPAIVDTPSMANRSTLLANVQATITLKTPKRLTKAPPTMRPTNDAKLRIVSCQGAYPVSPATFENSNSYRYRARTE